MASKIKRFIIEDFDNTYSSNIDISKILDQNGYERNERSNANCILYKRCNRLLVSISVILMVLVVGLSLHLNYFKRMNYELFSYQLVAEYRDFLKSSENESEEIKKIFSASIDGTSICITKGELIDGKANIYYLVESVYKERLYLNDIEITGRGYGLLCVYHCISDGKNHLKIDIDIAKKIYHFGVNL